MPQFYTLNSHAFTPNKINIINASAQLLHRFTNPLIIIPFGIKFGSFSHFLFLNEFSEKVHTKSHLTIFQTYTYRGHGLVLGFPISRAQSFHKKLNVKKTYINTSTLFHNVFSKILNLNSHLTVLNTYV